MAGLPEREGTILTKEKANIGNSLETFRGQNYLSDMRWINMTEQ
jgi:hypothetical protein